MKLFDRIKGMFGGNAQAAKAKGAPDRSWEPDGKRVGEVTGGFALDLMRTLPSGRTVVSPFSILMREPEQCCSRAASRGTDRAGRATGDPMNGSTTMRRRARMAWIALGALGLGAIWVAGCGRGAARPAAPSVAAGPEWNGRSLSEWVQRFRSHDNAMTVEAAVALGKIGEPAVPALVDALRNDSDNLVREEAARVLARIGPVAVPELARTFLDAPPAVQASAREAIASMGPAALHELVKLLKGGDKAGKLEALGLLERLGDKGREACGAIDDARRDPELGVRIRAGALLQKMCR